jgi:hypothetical protein
MGHHNNNERANVKVAVGWPTVVQAHVKLPTLGKHQSLSVSRGVRKPFHEAADFTLECEVGRVWFSRVGVLVKVEGGWSGIGRLGDGMRLVQLLVGCCFSWMLLNV